MNRFSQDIAVFDSAMPYLIGSTYVSLYQLLATATIAIVIVPYSAIFLVASLILFIIFYKMSIPASKETARVSTVTMSPLLSFVGEVVNGISTIRAFENTDKFVTDFHKLLNNNIIAK